MCLMSQLLSIDELLSFVLTDYALEENIVYAIDDEGLGCILTSGSEVLQYWGRNTIKVQSMEKFNQEVFDMGQGLARQYGHYGPVTCHAFYAPKGARSFPVHTDPDDVIVYVAQGTKCMEVAGQEHQLQVGQTIRMAANIPHRAINRHESLMLSFGLEKFMKDKAF